MWEESTEDAESATGRFLPVGEKGSKTGGEGHLRGRAANLDAANGIVDAAFCGQEEGWNGCASWVLDAEAAASGGHAGDEVGVHREVRAVGGGAEEGVHHLGKACSHRAVP